MYLLRYLWARACIALYFSISVLLASIEISGTRPAGASGQFSPFWVALILMPLHLAIYAVLLNVRKELFFRRAFLPASGLAVAGILAAGIFVDSDFLRTTFHVLASLYVIFLYRKDLFPWSRGPRSNTRFLFWFSLLMAFAGFAWVLVYGFYGLVLRTSGAVYWMLFNLYTIGILIVGLNAIMYTRQALFTQVRVTASSLEVDGRDCTMLLGRKDLLLLRIFIQEPGRHATCARIIEGLASGEDGAEESARAQCYECIMEKHKATLCPSYRRVYNQILKVKKILETMDIGTIVPPKNKMNVTVDGWVLRIFENVHLHYQPKTALT